MVSQLWLLENDPQCFADFPTIVFPIPVFVVSYCLAVEGFNSGFRTSTLSARCLETQLQGHRLFSRRTSNIFIFPSSFFNIRPFIFQLDSLHFFPSYFHLHVFNWFSFRRTIPDLNSFVRPLPPRRCTSRPRRWRPWRSSASGGPRAEG